MAKIKKRLIDIERKILWNIPRRMAHKIIYFQRHHKMMNMKAPMEYDEKIHQLMAEMYDESYGKYADKYEVREYVKKCGLEELLIPIYGVWNTAGEIDYVTLPDKFVLKLTHGSGKDFYEICRDKKLLQHELIKRKFEEGMKIKFSRIWCEYHYEKITPRIICEQLLEDKGRNI